MTNNLSTCATLMLLGFSQLASGSTGFSMNAGDPQVIAEEGAWCWFADPRALHHKSKNGEIDKTYVGYIDIHGNIKATQFDFTDGTREDVLIRSWFQPDDHNNPTFLVLPDERVMVFYSRHTDEPCFYYRVSSAPGDLTTLGEEKVIRTENNTTYPSPFILSDDPEHIYLCWRGINWHPTIARLSLPDSNDDVNVDWGPYQMVQSTGARPYAKYQSNGKDRIMVAYTTGHPDNELPNYLYFNYVDINNKKLLDIEGKELSDIASGPLKVDKDKQHLSEMGKLAVDMPDDARDWLWQIAAGSDGNPVVATTTISPDKSAHAYYLTSWDGKKWNKNFIANAGGHFHQTPTIEKCYTAGMAVDPDSTEVVYCSVPKEGRFGKKYEIVKYRLNENGEVTDSVMVTSDSEYNNVRPYIIGNSSSSPLRLVWMRGDYFDWIVSRERPLGYNTSIVGDESVGSFHKPVSLAKRVMTGEKFAFHPGEEFQLTTVVEPAEGNGMLLDLGDMKYCIDPESQRPEIRVGKKIFRSTNKLATSDSWRHTPRATDGKWHAPVVPESVALRMVYEDGNLSVYINGALDQKVKI